MSYHVVVRIVAGTCTRFEYSLQFTCELMDSTVSLTQSTCMRNTEQTVKVPHIDSF